MASFGGIQATAIHGSPIYPQNESEVWKVSGMDGMGVRILGKRVKESTITLSFLTDKAGANRIDRTIKNMAGGRVRVVDDVNRSYDIYVLDTSAPEITAAYIPDKCSVLLKIQVTGLVCN